LHIGLQSTHDAIHVGAVACRDTLDDLDPLVARMSVELDALDRAVVPAPRSRSLPARRRRPT
jgi:hypothetical protein